MSDKPIASIWVAHGSPDPAGLRNQLTPDVAAVFDREWEFVLERSKQTQDLNSIFDLLVKWRFVVFAERREPGWYFQTLDVAERILAAGSAEAAGIQTYDARAVLEARLGSELPAPAEGSYSVGFLQDARRAVDALPAESVAALAQAVTGVENQPRSGALDRAPGPAKS